MWSILGEAAELNKNIARIAKRCPENITSIVKCVKFLFPKVVWKLNFFKLEVACFFVEEVALFF